MRYTTISSSIASVVRRVIDTVAIAGAVRTMLHLTLMREHMGYCLEPCRPGFAFAGSYCSCPIANPQPGKPGGKRPSGHFDTLALAVCTTPSRLTFVRAKRRG